MTKLTLELNQNSEGIEQTAAKSNLVAPNGSTLLVTPAIGEDYWLMRVRLNETGQAIVAFPKFTTIGIGFAQEDDWNTNLPYTTEAERIFSHIKHNKGDAGIPDALCLEAIRLIQAECIRIKESK